MYSNLLYFDILEIKKSHNDFKIVFNFLDKLVFEIKKVSLKFESIDTIIFVDYHDNLQYIVNIELANKILTSCYDEFFFKPLLQKVHYENNLKVIWGENKWLDFFSKKLFICLKNNYARNKDINFTFMYNAISNISINCIFTRSEREEFLKLLKSNLKKFDLINLKKNYMPYFPLSYETFLFSKQEDGRDYCRYYQYCDLLQLLKSKKFNDLNFITKIDKIIHLIILISFINAKFIKITDQYNDNSYIKNLIDSTKKIPQIELIH